jgi:2,4-dienoyl-CoA reductase-like NADH-dependent reductase (Old Yellow Enzyme family)
MLFTPARIGALRVPNRLVRSATGEGMADPDGRPQHRLGELWAELARGGIGLIISGHAFVHPSGQCSEGMSGIWAGNLVSDWRAITDAVHQAGGLVAMQLNHGGRKCEVKAVLERIAPSDWEYEGGSPPARAMTEAEIAEMIKAFGQSARWAQEAGFDAVQVHAAHGYLISQFLSPRFNRRDDAWGGSSQKRRSFLKSVCREVRASVGTDYPVLIKLGMYDDPQEGGLTVEESLGTVAQLAGYGLDAVEFSGAEGDHNAPGGILPGKGEGYFRFLAQRARPLTDLPIISVGGYRSRSLMDQALRTGDADLISLCRPVILEPDLPLRFQQGQEAARCVSCGRCGSQYPGQGVGCHHPRLGPSDR